MEDKLELRRLMVKVIYTGNFCYPNLKLLSAQYWKLQESKQRTSHLQSAPWHQSLGNILGSAMQAEELSHSPPAILLKNPSGASDSKKATVNVYHACFIFFKTRARYAYPADHHIVALSTNRPNLKPENYPSSFQIRHGSGTRGTRLFAQKMDTCGI